ncbi:hypothetical protein HJFPF1_10229 [Paramyrothecium foliicola]|nr:hypothetical protein HJFPF1_10229 [Paramyrothecium foliicola]
MATPTPSPLFDKLIKLWRHLPLRSDVDGIISELLGRFSLEKLYCDAANKEVYQRLVITLLSQLTAILFFQRLSLPAENIHPGPYLGLLASWEVVLRSVEFVLLILNDGRELLWECRQLRDKHLARFLLLALRLLVLHPRGLVTQRAKEGRDRLARVHKALERVFDSYPGDKSVELILCKELTNKLHTNPNSLGLPQRLRNELPNLTTDLYPLPGCLCPPHIRSLVPDHQSSDIWLAQYLTLRDITLFIAGASIDATLNSDNPSHDVWSACADSRDAVLHTVDAINVPDHIAKPELTASLVELYRIILPNTPNLNHTGYVEEDSSGLELDALENLAVWCSDRQIVHRVSDGEMVHGVSQILRDIADDNTGGHSGNTCDGIYVVNCSQCHFIRGSQLKVSNVPLHASTRPLYIDLPLQSKCLQCGDRITIAREVQVARRAWELLGDLEIDAGAINVARHLSTAFQTKPEPLSVDTGFGLGPADPFDNRDKKLHPYSNSSQYQLYSGRPPLPSPSSTGHAASVTSFLPSPSSPPRFFDSMGPFGQARSRQGSSSHFSSTGLDHPADPSSAQIESSLDLSKPQTTSLRRASEASTEKTKPRWKLPFSSSKKPAPPPPIISGDSSSLSSSATENHRVDEISLASLVNADRGHSRGKAGKAVNVHLSQSSTMVFWTQFSLEAWNGATNPPTLLCRIPMASTCILAVVSDVYLAFVVGTRDQKLTLKIVNLAQPTVPAIEYRMPSKPWCKSIAIDRNHNYVALGFENAIVRFFKMTNHEQPREDRLHQHPDCRSCPSVDTLSFSNDGLALLASTRSLRTGIIQSYLWRFPFLTFQELSACRYPVPLHESEDNGVSAAVYRSDTNGEGGLVCITTWTQSGTPVLVDSRGGHRSPIRSEASGRHGKLGNRIQCAAFSPSGQELAIVNDKGHVFHISNLNSQPIDVRRVASSKELTGKSTSYSMTFATAAEEDFIMLAWTDVAKSAATIKKIPVANRVSSQLPLNWENSMLTPILLKRKESIPRTPAVEFFTPNQNYYMSGAKLIMPVELAAEHGRTELEASTLR